MLLLGLGFGLLQDRRLRACCIATAAAPGCPGFPSFQVQYKLHGSHHFPHTIAASDLASSHSCSSQAGGPLGSLPPVHFPESTHPAVIGSVHRLWICPVFRAGSCLCYPHCLHNHHPEGDCAAVNLAKPSPQAHCCCHPPPAAALLHKPLTGPLQQRRALAAWCCCCCNCVQDRHCHTPTADPTAGRIEQQLIQSTEVQQHSR